eukprot:jgi/Mesen1/8000/ME000425S07198
MRGEKVAAFEGRPHHLIGANWDSGQLEAEQDLSGGPLLQALPAVDSAGVDSAGVDSAGVDSTVKLKWPRPRDRVFLTAKHAGVQPVLPTARPRHLVKLTSDRIPETNSARGTTFGFSEQTNPDQGQVGADERDPQDSEEGVSEQGSARDAQNPQEPQEDPQDPLEPPEPHKKLQEQQRRVGQEEHANGGQQRPEEGREEGQEEGGEDGADEGAREGSDAGGEEGEGAEAVEAEGRTEEQWQVLLERAQSGEVSERERAQLERKYGKAIEPVFAEVLRPDLLDDSELRAAVAALGGGGGGKSGGESELVMATFASVAFKDFLLNWLESARAAGLARRVLVAAFDEPTYEAVRLRAGLGERDFRGNATLFRGMGVPKALFVRELLRQGRAVLLSDTDVVWLADPLPFLRAEGLLPHADVLVSSDSISVDNDAANMRTIPLASDPAWYKHTTARGGEMFGSVYENSYNTGMLVFQPTPGALQLVDTWLETLRANGKNMGWDAPLYDDQDAFNRLMRLGIFPIQIVEPPAGRPKHNRIFWAFERRVRMGVLPPGRFCNGHVYFVQRSFQRLPAGERPFAVHNTFQFSMSAGKVMRFRDAHLWHLDPDSYYTEGNFLALDGTLPDDLLVAEEDNEMDRHVAVMAFYYRAVRNALAIARVLGRILPFQILIHVVEDTQRAQPAALPNPSGELFQNAAKAMYWLNTEPPCRLPGVDVDPPYSACPMDHLFDVERWSQSGLAFRESTFLQHPRVPPAVSASASSTLPAGAAAWNHPRLHGIVEISVVPRLSGEQELPPRSLPENATDVEVRRFLEPYRDRRVLHLSSSRFAFCRFVTVEDNRYFDSITIDQALFGVETWCCEPGKTADDELIFRYFQPPPRLLEVDPDEGCKQ